MANNKNKKIIDWLVSWADKDENKTREWLEKWINSSK